MSAARLVTPEAGTRIRGLIRAAIEAEREYGRAWSASNVDHEVFHQALQRSSEAQQELWAAFFQYVPVSEA